MSNRGNGVAVRFTLVLACVISLVPAAARADGERGSDSPRTRAGWVFVPGVLSSPERGLTFAATVLRYFHRADRRTSSARATAEVSVEGDVKVVAKPELWLRDDRLVIDGRVAGSFTDALFYGIGNDTPADAAESFESARGELGASASWRVVHTIFVGGLLDLEYLDVLETEAGGLLDSGAVTGSDGGWTSGIGAMARYDTRDNSFAPSSGSQVELSPRVYNRVLGSDSDFVLLRLDGSHFRTVWRDHVLAVDGRFEVRFGEPSFNQLAEAGGPRLLRGLRRGRYRDRNYAAMQLEYRFPVWWRFGAVAFASTGRVASRVGDFDLSGWKYSVGGGARFAIKQTERINVRLDLGVSEGGTALYFNVLEAF